MRLYIIYIEDQETSRTHKHSWH